MLIIYNNCYSFTECFVASFSLMAYNTKTKIFVIVQLNKENSNFSNNILQKAICNALS